MKKSNVMGELVTIQVKLRAFVRRDSRSRWVAVCPSIGVASGRRRGVDLFSMTFFCEAAMEQLRAITHGDAIMDRSDRMAAAGEIGDRDETDVRGEAFPVDVAIPAYQAAAFLAHM